MIDKNFDFALLQLAASANSLKASVELLRKVADGPIPEPVARASSERSEFIEKASDKAFNETFVHHSKDAGEAKQGSVQVNRIDVLARFNGISQEEHEKALIHALRDVNDGEIDDAIDSMRDGLSYRANMRAAMNSFLSKRRAP